MKKFIISLCLFFTVQAAFFDDWTEFNKRNKGELWKALTGQDLISSKKVDSGVEDILPRFSDVVGGVPKEFLYLRDQLLKNSNVPKGILLQGPSGIGKTYLVRAFSGETGAKIFNVSASQLMGGFVGDGPRNVKAAFDKARNYIKRSKSPAIIFFDEFDAIGKRYESETNAAVAEESKKTINELLAQMDGFEKDNKLIVICATNHPDLIDEALKRPGRLDFIIALDLPDMQKRAALIRYYMEDAKSSIFEFIDVNYLSEVTGGFNCAEIKQLVVEASLNAKSSGSSTIKQDDFLYAIESRKKIKKIDFKEQVLGTHKIGFKDIIGGVPREFLDLKAFLENDEAFAAVGATRPSGILMVGPPGTGKTMLARAVAGEIDAVFFAENASSFIELYEGTGPKKIREIFDKARNTIQSGVAKKVIIFFDEIDSIGSRSGSYSGSSEENRTIAELLIQMDGFKKNENIIILAATNRPELLDAALKRPGRFDYIVQVPLPDLQKRQEILEYYMFCVPRNVSNSIDFSLLAQETQDFNCSELKDLINRSAINAVRKNRKIILKEDLDEALLEIKRQKVY
jgi:transitional endoplasmic reticulum ATPase